MLDSAEIGRWAGGGVAVALTLALVMSRVLKALSGDRRDVARINAETDVVVLLRAELNRVVEQNVKLELEVTELRQLVATLREESLKLTAVVEQANAQLRLMRFYRDDSGESSIKP